MYMLKRCLLVTNSHVPLEPKHLVGVIAGWLAGRVTRGKGFGLIGNLIVGILGAFIGDWQLPRLNVHVGAGIVALIVNALVGATVVIFLLWLMGGSGWRHRGWGYGRWGRRW